MSDDPKAMITVGKADYVLAIWTVVGRDQCAGDLDWMCIAIRRGGRTGTWEIHCRIRFGDGTKRLLIADPPAEASTDREVLAVGNQIAGDMQLDLGNPYRRVMIRGGPMRMAKRLRGRAGFSGWEAHEPS